MKPIRDIRKYFIYNNPEHKHRLTVEVLIYFYNGGMAIGEFMANNRDKTMYLVLDYGRLHGIVPEWRMFWNDIDKLIRCAKGFELF